MSSCKDVWYVSPVLQNIKFSVTDIVVRPVSAYIDVNLMFALLDRKQSLPFGYDKPW